MSNDQTIFGIDLGTTSSCIAFVNGAGKAEVVPNSTGDLTTPSVVLFESSTSRVVGKEAKNCAQVYPDRVVEMVKRHMGDPTWTFYFEGVEYRPEEISAYILRKVVGDAQAQLNTAITDVVITCPAYFGITEREATARAGQIAGLNVLEIISEPTAAAISFGTQNEHDQVVLVYDLGGGNFDITMIEIKAKAITVISAGGDKELGGRDWDAAVVTYLAQEWMRQAGSSDDPTTSPDSLQDLWSRAEDAKKALSVRSETRVRVSHAGQAVTITLTREKFDELTAGLLEQTILVTKHMLDAARQKGYTRFDKLLLVGGSTRMPQVPERLKREFGIDPQFNEPDLSVAKGAALYGQKLAVGEKIRTAVASMTGQNRDDLDLSAVAPSVVQQAEQEVANSEGVMLRDVQRLHQQTITNVVSHSFGVVAILTSGGLEREVISNLAKKNDPLPVAIRRRFGTYVPNQTRVDIHVMENDFMGEQVDDIAYGREVGNVVIEGLPYGLPASSPIDVTFQLDQQGRLHVEGAEPTSGKRAQVTIEYGAGFSAEEIASASTGSRLITLEERSASANPSQYGDRQNVNRAQGIQVIPGGMSQTEGTGERSRVRFSAFYPRIIPVEMRRTLVVYVHMPEAEPGIRAEMVNFQPLMGSVEPHEVTITSTRPVSRGTYLTIVPDCDGIEFNPPSMRLRWGGSRERAIFEFQANRRLEGLAVNGEIDIYVEALNVATLNLTFICDEADADTPDDQHESTAQLYERIFASYSHADTRIVEACKRAYSALGMKVLIDTEDLRSGEEFTPALMHMIDDANVFQLFWSERSAQSAFVRQEWMHALRLNKGPRFIRPVRWERPLVPAPPELAALKIHFKYIPLPSVDEDDAPPTLESQRHEWSAAPAQLTEEAPTATSAAPDAAISDHIRDDVANQVGPSSSSSQANQHQPSKEHLRRGWWPWRKR